MREVSSIFAEGFTIGLRPEKNFRVSSEHLERCLNVLPTKQGLEPRPDVIWPVDYRAGRYPFPYLAILKRYSLLFTQSAVYKVLGDWSLQLVANRNWGSRPHIADFFNYAVVSAKNGCWAYDGNSWVNGVGGAEFKTCINFNGQLVVGDCTLPSVPGGSPCSTQTQEIVSGEGLVAWSAIGSIDWDFCCLSNEAGWAPMPWPSSVLGLLQLGQEIVVYGDNGIGKLSPVSEPVPTFGIHHFGDVGVLNRDCFAGGNTGHIFVGNDYNLWSILPQRALSNEGWKPTKLGYEEWLRELQDPIVSYDPIRQEWWIGDKNKCYVFTLNGMGEASCTPGSLSRLDGQLIGFSFEHGSDIVSVRTGPLSNNSRGLKTVMCVESELSAEKKVYGDIQFRYGYDQSWHTKNDILLDPRGAWFPIAAGVEHKLTYHSEDFHNFYLSKLYIHYKNTDRTFHRGIIDAGRPSNEESS